MTALTLAVSHSILIVEDDELFAEYLRAHLEHHGYRICAITDNGLSAVALAQSQRPDIVLMDIQLSGKIDGIDTADRIRTDAPIPVLFMTAHEDPQVFARAKITDPSGYLLKPFNERELLFAIELALHRHQLNCQRERENQTAVQLAQRNYNDLVARLPVGIFTFRISADGEKGFDFVSPRFCELTGLSAETITQDPMRAFDVLHADDRADFFRLARAAATLRQAMFWEGRVLLDTHTRWMRIQSHPTIEANGDVIWNGVEIDITERRQAENELGEAHQRLQALSTRLLTIQEEERRSLARELHDEIGQSLSALKMALQSLSMHAEAAIPQPRLQLAVDIANSTLVQVRQMSLDLRPPQLDDLGLPAAVRWNLERQCNLTGLAAHFSADDMPSPLPEPVAIACYRIAQESITNTIKHARAKNIWISLHWNQNQLTLVTRDDGCGFDRLQMQEQVRVGASMGMVSMQERAAMANGRLNIDTASGAGTTVQAQFALTTPPIERNSLEPQ